MPKKTPDGDDRISARVGELKGQIARYLKKSGHKEAHVVRAALDLFFTTNPTTDAAMAAIRAYRAKEASR